MIYVNLEELNETARLEILKLATESIDSQSGRFLYDSQPYAGFKNDQGVVNIYKGDSPQYIMKNWPPEIRSEFNEKVKIAKVSSNPDDRKFTLGGVDFVIKQEEQQVDVAKT